ncbi:MAG: DUF3597 domain-containing protein [Gemmatimonadales bacterium]
MSIFGNILSKIFNHPAAGTTSSPAPSASPAVDAASFDDVSAGASTSTPASMSRVDVEQVLTDIASKYNHPVNWRYSIVDLMAILGIDNSLTQRKALAHELGYTGDTNDSATMNIWLHKQVMQKLAENGGHVPAELMQENE